MKFINENDKAYEIQLKKEILEDEIRELATESKKIIAKAPVKEFVYDQQEDEWK